MASEVVAAKSKSVKVPKEKKAATVVKKPRTHPPYADMIKEAISSLKERTGSSQYAISKFIEDKQKDLSPLFKKHISLQLKKLVASGNLTKVKSSFKLSVPVKAPVEKKKSVVAAKPKKTVVAAKPKKGAAVAAAPVKAKKKAVAKPKAAVEKKAKAAKASSLGKRKAVEKNAAPVKKAVVKPKAVKKVKSLKSPVKKQKK